MHVCMYACMYVCSLSREREGREIEKEERGEKRKKERFEILVKLSFVYPEQVIYLTNRNPVNLGI